MIEAQGITVRLGGRETLHGIDFAAQPGQITAIVGPNGSGKTTFLRALTGELKHRGTVWLNGRATADIPVAELAGLRAVLPQSVRMAFPFTVSEVVRMGLRAGLSAGRDSLILPALDRVGATYLADRPYTDLSGGEQQRVQLARVLAQIWEPVVDDIPRWLFLDEPVSSLDPGHQFLVIRTVRDFAARGGGVIAVMHDLNLTAMMADRITVLKDGRVAANGTAQEVMTEPVLSRVYDCPLRPGRMPAQAMPFLLPQASPLEI
ncbi:heme ABC transporter ATP-binding protein [Chachezhania sediminis]|uniref:heme ABC transporter ATP-binding protein n=1 Tax=Chachezhania sediminis TaxID=2599291 RepID=UPI00131D555E|nr:heme ABC transporter ATP-binding protein [Chachezhania sediminis]